MGSYIIRKFACAQNVIQTDKPVDGQGMHPMFTCYLPSGHDGDHAPGDPFSLLTEREREAAIMLADGKSSREIATRMNISQKTVDTHRCHVLTKLALAGNVELCKLAIKYGVIQP